jgi:hypothetical protein
MYFFLGKTIAIGKITKLIVDEGANMDISQ